MQRANKSINIALPVLLITGALAFMVSPGSSQDPATFVIDHQRAYHSFPRLTVTKNITLRDQFGESSHQVLVHSFFSFPVDKNDEGLLHPDNHYSWYLLDNQTEFNPPRKVVVTNQFGEAELDVIKEIYLLAPAIKNPSPGAPALIAPDHYKCYSVTGPETERFVVLRDQFVLQDNVKVMRPTFLCNPVEKTLLDGTTFGISNPNQHLVCYSTTSHPETFTNIGFQDQFLDAVIVDLGDPDWLCVPSLKDEVVQTEESSWGKMKSIYR